VLGTHDTNFQNVTPVFSQNATSPQVTPVFVNSDINSQNVFKMCDNNSSYINAYGFQNSIYNDAHKHNSMLSHDHNFSGQHTNQNDQWVHPEMQNKACQTVYSSENDKILPLSCRQENIFSVNSNLTLPLVNIEFARVLFPFLIDTGSSLSIMSHQFFTDIKSFLHYKFLSRAVSISTINSVVQFKGCAEVSFKINGHFFKHPLFLVDIPSSQPFKGLVGMDFISKFGFVLNFEKNCMVYKNEEIPLVNTSLTTFNENNTVNVPSLINNVNETSFNSNNEIKIVKESASQATQCDANNLHNDNTPVEQPHIICNNNSNDSGSTSIDVIVDNVNSQVRNVFPEHSFAAKMHCKTILQPHEEMYIPVYCNLPSSITLFTYEHNFDPRLIECKPSLHEKPNSAEGENSPIDDNVNNSNKFVFYVYIVNLSTETIVYNKNLLVGHCMEVDQVKFPQNPNQTNSVNEDSIHLITATEQTLQLRREEFSLKNFNIGHLKEQELTVMQSLLNNNWSVFASSLKSMGHTDAVKPSLTFTQDFPLKSLPFPIPQNLQAEAKRQLHELLEAGIISKHISDWASPMLLVKKKIQPDSIQKYRLAIDMRVINSIITQSSYPLPKINNIISNISQFSFFSSLDLQAAYHQVHLPSHLRDKLTFTTPFGTFCYNRLLFGLKNSASIFQALMDMVVEETDCPGIFAYQDDIIVASNSFDETIGKLSKLFQVMTKYNLTLSPEKCQFHSSFINYLGFNISQHCIKPIESNIIKITSFPLPQTKRQLKKFIGLTGFYRHLVPRYADKVAPLTKLTHFKTQFVWSEECKNAFDDLQKFFFNQPFLRQPDWTSEFYLNTDASKTAISACLMQRFENNQLLPVSYFSKTLSDSEKRYPALKLELLAIVRGVQAFKFHLYNRRFVILSDSQPLKFYRKSSSPADITTRWLMELSEYSYVFQHIPGNQNFLADYFSRIPQEVPQQSLEDNPSLVQSSEILPVIHEKPSEENCCMPEVSHVLNNINVNTQDPLLEISSNTFVTEQLKDPDLSLIYNKLLNKIPINNKNYFIDKETSMLKINPTSKENSSTHPKIVVPKSLVHKVCRISHLTHLGIHKTFQFTKDRYYWINMFSDIQNFVKSCTICIASKPQRIPPAPFQQTILPNHPNDAISLDIVGPFRNKCHILTVIDLFSRHLELYPITKIDANTVAEKIFKYITTFGRPAIILTDLGTQFTAQVFESLNAAFGIKLLHTTTGRPQANAISERINTSIKSTVAAIQAEGKSFWHAVDLHKSLYNSSVHSSTKYSPNAIHFARELSLITDTFDTRRATPILNQSFALLQIVDTIQEVYDKVHNNLKLSQEYNRRLQQDKAKMRTFAPNDIVYMKPIAASGFHTRLNGPYIIKRAAGPVTYVIQRLGNPSSKQFKIHVDRLYLAPPRRSVITPTPTGQPTNNVLNCDNNSLCSLPNSSLLTPQPPTGEDEVRTPATLVQPNVEPVLPTTSESAQPNVEPVLPTTSEPAQPNDQYKGHDYDLRPRKK
jgi:transposase InsO family protein